MQDKKNLKRRVLKCERFISICQRNHFTNRGDLEYWQSELKDAKARIADREKNQKKNAKQHKKAN